MLNHTEAHAGRSGERLAHHAVFEDGMAIVGDCDGASGFQRGEVIEGLPFGTACGGGDGIDAHVRAAVWGKHPAGDFGCVIHRRGIGHRGDGCESAGGSSGGTRGDGLLVALSGLAQVHMNVDQAGGNGETGRIENLGSVDGLELSGCADLGDATVFEQDVFGRVHTGGGVDQLTIANQNRVHCAPPLASARSTTAMRMATPLVTCSRIADCAPSATPAVSSRPRMMGPGCITTAVGAWTASRWPVS